MSKEQKIKRSQSDLRTAFVEQVALLMSYCQQFDAGDHKYAKPMATALRVMLHKSRHSQPILDQLRLRTGRFFTVAEPLNPNNVLSECNLVYLRGSLSGAAYVPQLELRPGFKHRMPFPEWWVRPIAKGQDGQTMSRMDIVLSVADTDGGAHVDGELPPKYASFRAGKFLGWYFIVEGQKAELIESPEYGCIRAIAHEVLLTLQAYAPWSFPQRYQQV